MDRAGELKEIDNVEFVEICQAGRPAGMYMGYREKIDMLLDKFGEGRLKEIYNFLIYCYLRS